MRANLRYAVMSFCPDLTSPTAVSRPVAIVGAGRIFVPGGRKNDFAFYVARTKPDDDPGLPQDKFSRSVLNSLPALFDQQILGAVSGVGVAGFLPWLQNRFRNSLHVASMNQTTIDAKSVMEVQLECVRLYFEIVVGAHSVRPEKGKRQRQLGQRMGFDHPSVADVMGGGWSFNARPMETHSLEAVG